MSNNEALKPYANLFKAWQAKAMGPKPTAEQLATAHAFGRPGKQSLALAMAMRDVGVTAPQIIMAAGAPQNNHRVAEIKAGHFKRERVAPDDLGHTVYKITLTPKGQAAIKRRADADAKANLTGDAPKAAKPKAKRPRKAKGTAAVTEAAAAPAPEATAPAAAPEATGSN